MHSFHPFGHVKDFLEPLHILLSDAHAHRNPSSGGQFGFTHCLPGVDWVLDDTGNSGIKWVIGSAKRQEVKELVSDFVSPAKGLGECYVGEDAEHLVQNLRQKVIFS